jgi:hypothetical protein
VHENIIRLAELNRSVAHFDAVFSAITAETAGHHNPRAAAPPLPDPSLRSTPGLFVRVFAAMPLALLWQRLRYFNRVKSSRLVDPA